LLLLAEDLQELQRMGRLGNEQRLAQFAEQVGLRQADVVEQRLDLQHAEDIAVAAAVDRVA
jgi:hypothetical protein